MRLCNLHGSLLPSLRDDEQELEKKLTRARALISLVEAVDALNVNLRVLGEDMRRMEAKWLEITSNPERIAAMLRATLLNDAELRRKLTLTVLMEETEKSR